MRVDGEPYRTIWPRPDDRRAVCIIDQRYLPHRFRIETLSRYGDGVIAIRDMLVRGAPLIGATAAWSLYLAALEAGTGDRGMAFVREAAEALRAARPTAVNLSWALDRVLGALERAPGGADLAEVARTEAQAICDEDVAVNQRIGEHGVALIEAVAARKPGAPVNVLTHCNAGWLATVDWGTATAPIYLARSRGVDVHVWVDETRPRNQGAQLTAWELGHEHVPHTVIVDNAGGHLMQRGQVDLCIIGTDRTARSGDVANKIGTYLKALAAKDNAVPLYFAVPSSSIDWNVRDGLRDIPIEERGPEEVSQVWGARGGELARVQVTPDGTRTHNPGFDVTPARLVTGLITERGVCAASEEGLLTLFPERAQGSGDERTA